MTAGVFSIGGKLMKTLITTLNSKFIHSSLAVSYIFTAVKNNLEKLPDFVVEKKEFTINNTSDYIYNEILAGDYSVICFSCYIWNVEKTLHICRMLRAAKPELVVILGGPEVGYTENVSEYSEAADYIVSGEGEKSVPELLEVLWRKRDMRFSRKSVPKLVSADPVLPSEIPFPYDEIEENKILYYESSRGCPYNCSYCISSIDKKLRFLPVDRVKAELEFFLDRNVKQVKFIDRTFNADRKRAAEIMRFLIEKDNGITNFHFEICAERLDRETFDIIKSARKGLFQFEIGIQSTNAATLGAVDRNQNVDILLGNIKRLIDMGNCHIHVDLIAGLPYEDYERFGVSFNQVYELGADALQLGFLKLLRGTKIRNEQERHGYIYDSLPPYQVLCNNYMRPEDLMKLKRIEHVLDEFSNKGGFEKSLDKLVEIFSVNGGAFGFFSHFAEFYYSMGFQEASHKKEDNYRILYSFAEKCLPEMAGEMKELIYSDLTGRMNQDAVKKFNRKGWKI